ncbi:precorrin-3B synthase [Mycolicibacterium moriokaense]|uniref:Precorrin-3B synthase n=1 Tax=Mycolicibacterium moriokaense TaxID=39691 RepID=A0AAD1M739_9MYCO|nr:precorrin-3B synthase [Mycolicibacterium moriokaense]MCV7038255.1 precorrin-3B synthase [Mycolicibacterium moriokaense]ORB24241.1 precorrin-3B synthase [Mycolicibacterium moriokaense]BBX02628.1 precorrin-3B synthase [Mycolicibacterium moriokaense]
MARTRDQDACPGALQVHPAADGPLARVRLPGGMITAPQLETLALTATRWASPAMELTSRGNIQIRAVADTDAVAEALASSGLLPSETHERVRNIVASPLSGRVGSEADIRGLVTELDRAIQAQPALAGLPGRFLFGIDDGRGDITGLAADAGIQVVDDVAALLLAGRDTGVRLPLPDAVPALLTVAGRFVETRGTCWRVSELDSPDQLLAGLAVTAGPGATWEPVTRGPIGWIEQNDGRIALGAAVPLGVLNARVAEYLAAINAPMVITPWRSLLVFDLTEEVADVALRVLAPMGLVFDENSPWLAVSACTGSPGCEHSAADVRSDAAAAIDEPAAGHRHFVGCDRACGSPATGAVLVATGDGYRLRDSHP